MIQRSLFLAFILATASTLAQNYTWSIHIPNGQTGSPMGREYHSLTHVKNATNSTYSNAVLFGGISYDGTRSIHLNDTWILRFPRDGWQQVTAPVHPPTRGYHTAVESNGEVIIFGGITALSFIYDDVWRFNVTSRLWSQDPQSVHHIPPRTFHSATHADGIMYVFGGFASELASVTNDLWAYNVSARNWTNLVPHDQPRSPPARQGATITYVESELGPSLIVFGGYTGKLGFNDLWQYYIRQNKWVQLNPDGNTDGPSRRIAHTAVGHSASSNKTAEIIVFGGFYDAPDSLPYYNDVWSLKLVGSVYNWKTLVPDGQRTGPAKRAGHTMIKAGNETLAFGGYVQGVGLVNDLWALNYHF